MIFNLLLFLYSCIHQIISYNFLNFFCHFTTWRKFSSTLQYGYHLTTCFSTNVLMYCQLLFTMITYGEIDNLEFSTRSTNAENTRSTTYYSCSLQCLSCYHNFQVFATFTFPCLSGYVRVGNGCIKNLIYFLIDTILS